MNATAAFQVAAAAVLVAIGACTVSSPPPAGLADGTEARPEPLRPSAPASAQAPPLTGFARAVTRGGTALFVIDTARMELTHPQGLAGDAAADSAGTLARMRAVVAGLRLWAEDGAVVIDGEMPFAGRARSTTRGGVLRFSLTPRRGGGSAEGALTAEVRGDEIVGRVWQRSAPGEAGEWSHSVFFRAPLRPVEAADWPPRPALSAERHVVTRAAGGAPSTPSASARVP